MSECRKMIKRLSNGWRILHIGDGNTNTKKDDILHLLSKLGCAFVTSYRSFALKVSKRYKVLLKTAGIFCERERKCRIVENNCTFNYAPGLSGREGGRFKKCFLCPYPPPIVSIVPRPPLF